MVLKTVHFVEMRNTFKEMWCWRRMEKINWSDRVKNEVLQRVRDERNFARTIKQRRAKWIRHTLRRTAF